MSTPIHIAEPVAARLGQINGVLAVVLGGSRARGSAHTDSDIDLGLYYEPAHRPSLATLRALACELDDRHPPEAATEFGEWGPWINGGAWLQIDGHHVDWLYRDLDRVTRMIEECRAGRPTVDYQIGHPHGFHNHMYMGEVHYCRPLHDPSGVVTQLKALTTPYPGPLKRTLIDKFLFEADFALMICEKLPARGDVFAAVGNLFRCVACLVQVLFALNETYFINEKGAVRTVDAFRLRPDHFGEIVPNVLAEPGTDAAALQRSIKQLRELVASTRELCQTSA
jgi:predicted nucleotidyltransferase